MLTGLANVGLNMWNIFPHAYFAPTSLPSCAVAPTKRAVPQTAVAWSRQSMRLEGCSAGHHMCPLCFVRHVRQVEEEGRRGRASEVDLGDIKII